MATIEARGYASFVENKTSGNGTTYKTFILGVKEKDKVWRDKPEKVWWTNYQVTDFSDVEIPDRAYVTVKGYLKVKEVTKDGAKRTFLEVKATEVTVAEPLEGQDAPAPKAKGKSKAPAADGDPWDD